MGDFIAYTVVAGLFLISGYIIYRLLLADDNQPKFNRAVILGIYAVSMAVWPLMRIDLSGPSTADAVMVSGVVPLISVPSENIPGDTAPVWSLAVAGVYLFGVLCMMVRTSVTFVRLLVMVRKGEQIRNGRYTVVLTDNAGIAPFSWGHYIVLSRSDYGEASHMILCHELAHIRARHFFDLLAAQAVCIILWYNPAAWFMLRELKAVHEYDADATVLRSGIEPREYQLLLIKMAVGVRFPSPANNLNHSKLKKRITMMLNSKNAPRRRLRALALLPAALAAVAVVNIPAVAAGIDSLVKADYSLPESSDKVKDFPALSRAVGDVKSSDVAADIVDRQVAAPAETAEPAESEVSPAADNAVETQSTESVSTPADDTKDSEKVYVAVDEMAEFPGGMTALLRWVAANIKYPESEAAGCSDKTKRVIVRFVIGADGKVRNPEILKGSNEACNVEALRVVSEMPDWTPALHNGKPVATYYTIPIVFRAKASFHK